MEHVVKQFSLIDFWGFFLPGAIMTFAINFYIWDVKIPYNSFFTENSVTLSIYFLALSYLLGTVLHQLGSMLEQFMSREENVYQNSLYQYAIRCAYHNAFQRDFPTESDQQLESGREIYRYIQRAGRPHRIVLFSAFYTMSRTMMVTLPLTALIILIFGTDPILEKLPLVCVCIIGFLIFCAQRKQFNKRCINEAYMMFIDEYTNQKITLGENS